MGAAEGLSEDEVFNYVQPQQAFISSMVYRDSCLPGFQDNVNNLEQI